MSDPKGKYNSITEMILSHPQGEEVREVAHKIADVVFDSRKKLFFSEISEENGANPETQKRLLELLENFRTKVRVFTDLEMPKKDDDLYRQIILPLVIHLIDKSA